MCYHFYIWKGVQNKKYMYKFIGVVFKKNNNSGVIFGNFDSRSQIVTKQYCI